LAQIIDDEDDSSAGTGTVKTKSLLVRRHGIQASHEGTICEGLVKKGARASGILPKPFIVEIKYPTDMMK
jgi:hypothetical protein